MKTIHSILLGAIVIAVSLSGCGQNERFGSNEENPTLEAQWEPTVTMENGTEVLVFSSLEEFARFDCYDAEQRSAFSQRNYDRFKSYADICEEIYESLDFESCKSFEDIVALVEENNEYLEMVTDEEGEHFVHTKFFYSPYKHIMNKDRIFFIEDYLYKVYDNAVLYVQKRNFKELMNLENLEITSEGINVPEGINIFYSNINPEKECIDCPIYEFEPEKPGTETKARIVRNSSCYSREWNAEPSPFPSYIGAVGHGGTDRHWSMTQSKDRIELDFGIRIEQNNSYWRSVPTAIVSTWRKTLGVWFREKHTIYFQSYVELWIDYSGKVYNDAYPVMDYIPLNIPLASASNINTLVVPMNQYWQTLKNYNAGTMYYNLYAKSAAMSNPLNVQYYAYTLYYNCLNY